MTYNALNELIDSNNWHGMSVWCGVWQYYESGAFEKEKFERVLSFLRTNGEMEMAGVHAHGIHDYANERYQKCDYPEEWIEEAEEMDAWIKDNEKHIYQWMYDLILEHKNEVLTLGEN